MTKSNDTSEQLRRLMSRHTATTAARPAGVMAPHKPVAAPPVPVEVKPVAVKPVEGPASKVSVRLTGPELAQLDHLILEVHQRVGERITVSDVMRIGLARITNSSPVASAEIANVKTGDARRNQRVR